MSSSPWPERPSLTRTQAWTLGAAGTGSFMVVLDLLAVSTALPEIHSSLHASVGTLAWTVNAYTLSFAVLLVTAATLGDRWGRRNLYAGGLALFALSSAACALAPDTATLLAARRPGCGRRGDHAAGAGAAQRRVPGTATRLGVGHLRLHRGPGDRGGPGPGLAL